MTFSKRSHEGYLLIDNRNSPGVSEEFIRSTGKAAPAVREGQVFESSILTCSHCQTGMIVNPLRTRDRAYCRGCDHYICDVCEAIRVKAGGACNSFARIREMACEAIVKNKLLIPTVGGMINNSLYPDSTTEANNG